MRNVTQRRNPISTILQKKSTYFYSNQVKMKAAIWSERRGPTDEYRDEEKRIFQGEVCAPDYEKRTCPHQNLRPSSLRKNWFWLSCEKRGSWACYGFPKPATQFST